jgi:hypothetical protein
MSMDDRVAINLSLSGMIHPSEIHRAMGGEVPIYTVSVHRPRRSFLVAKEQLELFRVRWYELLSDVRAKHGEACEVHVFPAVPPSVAVEMGRALLPKSDPYLVVYDHDRTSGGFTSALTL